MSLKDTDIFPVGCVPQNLQSKYDLLKNQYERVLTENHLLRKLCALQEINFAGTHLDASKLVRFLGLHWAWPDRYIITAEGNLTPHQFLVRLMELLKGQ